MSLLTDASLIVTPNAYKASKLYSVIPNTVLGDMNIVRATTATRVNSAGLIESVAINVPRLDYTLGSCPSILVEPQRTNLLLRSEEFENFAWNKGTGGSISANSVISPTGISNADAYTWAGSTIAFAYLSQTVSAISQNSHTFSIWLKRPFGSGSRTIRLSISDVNISTGTSITFTVTEAWQRFEFTRASASATGQVGVGLIFGASGTSIAAGEILNVWGAQLELGSSPTSYIPTTAAIATRNADVISKTGISSLIGPTEGTIYAEINNTLMTSYSTGYVMRIFADANNEVWIRKESGSNKYTAKWRANSVDVYTQSNISVLNGNNKIAIAYKTGNSAVYLNGTQIGTNASTGAFAVAPSQIGIGSSSTADFFNDRIELATVFPTRLTNAQLATLTTL
jgi:hypothetical protein